MFFLIDGELAAVQQKRRVGFPTEWRDGFGERDGRDTGLLLIG